MASEPDDAHGCCWCCGYSLRGVESTVCPECGRAFDRADRATMNFGRPMGRAARFLVTPIGWRAVLLTLIGATCILATTRWPVTGWDPSPRDLAPPIPATGDRKRVLLRSAIAQGWTPKDRLWAIKALSEMHYDANLLIEAIPGERDLEVKIWRSASPG